MHYTPHALLNCVAWLSLLAYGNAAKGAAPSEVLSHFAHTVGAVLVPSLSSDSHGARLNRSAEISTTGNGNAPSRRQVGGQEGGAAQAAPAPGPNSLPFGGQGFPYQYERTYQYRYPPYSQQISENFYPGGAATGGGFGGQHLPIDPRFFQPQIGGHHLAPIQPEIPKPVGVNGNANGNNNVKDNGNSNTEAVQNLDTNVDSKSSAQNRPYDSPGYGSLPVGPNQAGGLGPNAGNLRVDNRYSAIDYERVRQNYYSDPPINQRNYFSSFNEIPFSGGAPYRSPLTERYSNLDYSGGPGRGGPASDLRSGNGLGGLGDPYFGSFLQGPYQSLNYNNLPGSRIGGPAGSGEGGPPFADSFDRSGNFRYSGGGGLQYPGGGFDGGFYSGGDLGGGPGGPGGPGGFGEGDSSLRASSAKETLAESENAKVQEERAEREKVRFVQAEKESKEEKSAAQQA